MTEQTNFIVLDLEATCSEGSIEIPLEDMEIIEIGAVRLDVNLEATDDTFSQCVKPVARPELTPFCSKLTGIAQTEIDAADDPKTVLQAFVDWLGEDPVIAGWGMWDFEQLERECAAHGIAFKVREYVNIKREFYRLRKMKEGSLKSAIERAGLSFIGQHHRALADAQTTAQLVALCGLSDYDPLWKSVMAISGKTAIQLRPWLREKTPLLGGLTPMHLMLNPKGRAKMKDMIAYIEDTLAQGDLL